MLRKFLERFEDPELPLLGPSYWILQRTGFLLPANRAARVLCIAVHEVAVLFVLSQYVELWVVRADLGQVLSNLRISMLSVVCILKANTFVFWQERWRQVLRYVTDADQQERELKDDDPERAAVVLAYTRYCRRVTYSYWALVFLTFLTTVLQPAMLLATSQRLRAGLRAGTEPFPHVFSSWMPFAKDSAPGRWLTMAWHWIICAYGASVMAAYDGTVVVVLVFIGGKMDLLRLRCRRMPPAADPARHTAVIRELHQIHMELLKHSRLLDALLSPVMFLYVVMCSLMLCTSAYNLTMATNTTQKVLMAEYLIFGIMQLFVFTWHSNDVLYKSKEVCVGAYESAWWRGRATAQRDVLLLAGQLRIFNVFSAGPFAKLTLPTFINIMKGAYSYYTLLNK